MTMSKKQKLSVKKSIPFAVAIIVLLLVTHRTIIVPAKKTAASARLVLLSVKGVYDLIKNQDIINAGEKLKETKIQLQTTKTNLNALAWTRKIPFFGNYYQDAQHLINAGIYGLDTGNIIIETLKPYADLLGLKGEGSFVLGSAEDRIEKAVLTMAKVTPIIDEVEKKLTLIKKEIDQINPNRYRHPEVIFGKKIYSRITLAKNVFDQIYLVLTDGKPLVKSLPTVLGEPVPKRYFVLYQNESTMAYAVFRLKSGKISLENPYYLYRLNQAEIKKRTAVEDLEKLYGYLRGKTNIDGIVVVNGHALVKIMEILGSINFAGTQLTTDNDPRCNCPQVILELENYAKKGGKIEFFGSLMNTIIQKALGSSPRLYWGRLFKVVNEEFGQKHILVYLGDQEAQKGIETLSQ